MSVTGVSAKRELPDIATQSQAEHAGKLDWVGMEGIEVPLLLKNSNGQLLQVPARANAFVNLTAPNAKGIHMSRLYLSLLEGLAAEFTPQLLSELLGKFLASHQGISDAARLSMKFDYMVLRSALKTQNQGWRSYPVEITGHQNTASEPVVEISFSVLYSSTCPCSAALARQMIQDQFRTDFAEQPQVDFEKVLAWLGSAKGIMATPHSQRSEAHIKVRLQKGATSFELLKLLDRIEQALQTPVQTVVKREDEQEFARLNGQNLMFCEDAGRKIQNALNQESLVQDFWAKASHLESLHPHDAVSVVTKGIPGGFKA